MSRRWLWLLRTTRAAQELGRPRRMKVADMFVGSKATSHVLARCASAGAILFALFACTSTPPQPASHQVSTKQEMEQAQREYASCLHRGAVDLDDGKSAAASVGRMVRSYCLVKYERLVDLGSQDMSPDAKYTFRQKALERELQETTAAVLQERSERQAPGQ